MESIAFEAIRIMVVLLFPIFKSLEVYLNIAEILKTLCVVHDVRKCSLKFYWRIISV